MPLTIPPDHNSPLKEWECKECGSLNSELDATCQWCEELLEWARETEADRRIDERKHSK